MASRLEAPNVAVRRFAVVRAASLALKVAVAALAIYLLLRFLGGT